MSSSQATGRETAVSGVGDLGVEREGSPHEIIGETLRLRRDYARQELLQSLLNDHMDTTDVILDDTYIETISHKLAAKCLAFRESSPEQAPHEGPIAALFVMGLGGSGKSTIASQIIQRTMALVEIQEPSWEPDDYLADVAFDGFKLPKYRRPQEVRLKSAYDFLNYIKQMAEKLEGRGELQINQAIKDFETTLTEYSGTPTGHPLFVEVNVLASAAKSAFSQSSFPEYAVEIETRLSSLERTTTVDPYRVFQVEEYDQKIASLLEGKSTHFPIFDNRTRERIEFEFLEDNTSQFFIHNGANQKISVAWQHDSLEIVHRETIGNITNHTTIKQGESITSGETTITITQSNPSETASLEVVIGGIPHIVKRSDEGRLSCFQDNHQLTAFDESNFIPAQRSIDPKGKLLVTEGILTITESSLNQPNTTFVHLKVPYATRSVRMVHRKAENDGEEPDEDTMTDEDIKRRLLQLIEELGIDTRLARFHKSSDIETITNLSHSELLLLAYLRKSIILPDDLMQDLERKRLETLTKKTLERGGIKTSTIPLPDGSETTLVACKRGKHLHCAVSEQAGAHLNALSSRMGDLLPPVEIIDKESLAEGRLTLRFPGGHSALEKEGAIQIVSMRYLKSIDQALDNGYNARQGVTREWIEHFFEVQWTLCQRGLYDSAPDFGGNYGVRISKDVEQMHGGIRNPFVFQDIPDRNSEEWQEFIFSADHYPIPDNIREAPELRQHFTEQRAAFLNKANTFLSQVQNEEAEFETATKPSTKPDNVIIRRDLSRVTNRYVLETTTDALIKTIREGDYSLDAKACFDLFCDFVIEPGHPAYAILKNTTAREDILEIIENRVSQTEPQDIDDHNKGTTAERIGLDLRRMATDQGHRILIEDAETIFQSYLKLHNNIFPKEDVLKVAA